MQIVREAVDGSAMPRRSGRLHRDSFRREFLDGIIA
jgi:hypothetical protein